RAGHSRVTHPFAARAPQKEAFPHDLHVLSTPPAFVLSQDQTLQQNHEPGKHPPTHTKHAGRQAPNGTSQSTLTRYQRTDTHQRPARTGSIVGDSSYLTGRTGRCQPRVSVFSATRGWLPSPSQPPVYPTRRTAATPDPIGHARARDRAAGHRPLHEWPATRIAATRPGPRPGP